MRWCCAIALILVGTLVVLTECKQRNFTAKAGKRYYSVLPPGPPSMDFGLPFPPFGKPPPLPCDLHYPFRMGDGSCNNLDYPTWGQSRIPFIRFLPPDYGDGRETLRARKDGSPLPNARLVSLATSQDIPIENPHFTTLFLIWGQLMNHDVQSKLESVEPDGTLKECCLPGGAFNPDPECIPIRISKDDPFFSQFGVRCMRVARSLPFPSHFLEYRENVNNNTAFIDASFIYGSDDETMAGLRTFRHGQLQSTPVPGGRPLLPLSAPTVACISVTGVCFRTGDFRVNMLPPLTAIHIMFMREHNRIAFELQKINPHWGDERLFQEARKIVGAVTQHINYNEYLPLVLSPAYMHAFDLYVEKRGYYEGYDPYINPSIASSFAASAFRFGHSLIQGRFHRFHPTHHKLGNLAPPLGLELREPLAIFNGELDVIAIGMTDQRSRERDEQFTVEVTNRLFENRTLGLGSGGDLLAINVHRGRDNGIPSYNDWREYCGIERLHSFEDLHGTMPEHIIHAFGLVYGHVDDIDIFPAGISEYRVEGGIVGPTFSCMIAQQFKNLRKGDRFWYENGHHKGAFTPAQLEEIRKSSMARLYCDNFEDVETIQLRPMEIAKDGRIHCADPYLHSIDLTAWAEFAPYPEPHYMHHPPPPPPHMHIHAPDLEIPLILIHQDIDARSSKTNSRTSSRKKSKSKPRKSQTDNPFKFFTSAP